MELRTKVFVDGAYGTTGLELVAQLKSLPTFQLITIAESERRSLETRTEAFREADIVVLCLPDEEAKRTVKHIADFKRPIKRPIKILDASSAHRTAPHSVYGFRELLGQEDLIARASLVSNPGCYAIGFIALIRPLVEQGLIPPTTPLTLHGVSGYSGGGKALIETFEKNTPLGNPENSSHQDGSRQDGSRQDGSRPYSPYALTLDHKHLAEMRAHSHLETPPLFQPAVIQTYRGMLVSVPLHEALLKTLGVQPQQIVAALKSYYQRSKEQSQTGIPHTISIQTLEESHDQLLDGKFLPFHLANESEALQIIVAHSQLPHSHNKPNDPVGHVMLHARLDNLGKGASLNAVSNLKLMALSKKVER